MINMRERASGRVSYFLAPQSLLMEAALFAVFFIACTWWIAIQQPWLGINVANHSDENRGKAIAELHHNGKQVIAIEGGDKRIVLSAEYLWREPDSIPRYAQYRQFFENQDQLADLLNSKTVTLTLIDESKFELEVMPQRPTNSLPFWFWFSCVIGAICWMISVAVWAFRREQLAARLLFVMGFCVLVGSTTTATYLYRELALPGGLFRVIAFASHVGFVGFAASLVALFCSYPQKLKGTKTLLSIYVICALYVAMEIPQWFDWPFHSFLLAYPCCLAAGTFFAFKQWQFTKVLPIERAALSWLFLSLFGTMATAVLLYFLPIIIDGEALVPYWVASLLILLMFLGVTAGIVKFQLFNLQQWWLSGLLWFFGGIAVIGLDALLVVALNWNPISSLSVAILVAGWLYFPARQSLLRRWFSTQNDRLSEHLPVIIQNLLLATSESELRTCWRELLENLFEPLKITDTNTSLVTPRLLEHGLTLEVPSIADGKALQLIGCNRSRRLFSMSDLRLAQSVLDIAHYVASSHRHSEGAARVERQRIVRDLHDDVGARLVSLARVLQPLGKAKLATDTLAALRDTIYVINDEVSSEPVAFLALQWRAELEERLFANDVALHFSSNFYDPDLELPKRWVLNLTRILREGVTNALKHAEPENIWVHSASNQTEVRLHLSNDGRLSDPTSWPYNAGRTNMQNRVEELGGTLEWHLRDEDKESAKIELSVIVPLSSKELT